MIAMEGRTTVIFTRKISSRLAIGALERDVVSQFLVEAIVLSAFGGLVGIGLGISASAMAARALGVPLVLDVKIITLASSSRLLSPSPFGFFPARRAAGLKRIDMLRHE
jgi:putative ABC transport system permease protein